MISIYSISIQYATRCGRFTRVEAFKKKMRRKSETLRARKDQIVLFSVRASHAMFLYHNSCDSGSKLGGYSYNHA